MGPAIIARVNPKSLNITALEEDCQCYPHMVDFIESLSSKRTTHAGTAGVMFDFSETLGVMFLSSLSSRFLSVDTIRREAIIADDEYTLLNSSTYLS